MQIKVNIALPFMDEVNGESSKTIITSSSPAERRISIVTMPGLGLELRRPPLIPPRKMIRECKDVPQLYLRREQIPSLAISVPGGEEITKRTFNPVWA